MPTSPYREEIRLSRPDLVASDVTLWTPQEYTEDQQHQIRPDSFTEGGTLWLAWVNQQSGEQRRSQHDPIASDDTLWAAPEDEPNEGRTSQQFREKKDDQGKVSVQHEDSPQPEYPDSKQVAVGMVAIFLALFLVSLDRTILSTAVPSIADEFQSFNDIGWYGSAFMLAGCCSQLLFGRIYTFNRPKYVFLSSIVIFEIGSALCGAAPNSTVFIVGRAIAGLGAAGVTAGNIIIVGTLVAPDKRPMYMGMFGAVSGISSVAGPLLGGALTSGVSWRWCFYINLPIGAVVWLIVLLILAPRLPVAPGLNKQQQLAKLDLPGEAFLLPSVTCLLFALQWAGSTYAWSNWRVILFLCLFGVCWIAFWVVQIYRPSTATIHIRMLNSRSIVAGVWFMLSLSSTMLIMIFYIPVWLQVVKGDSAVTSGIHTVPLILSLVTASILSGQFTSRVGYYVPPMLLSSTLMSVGAGLMTTLTLETSTALWVTYTVIVGLGIGSGMQQAVVVAQTVLPKADAPMGVSLMIFTQQLGGAVFISAAQNLLQTSLLSNLSHALPSLDLASVLTSSGSTDFRNLVSAKDLPFVLKQYNAALRHVFLISVCGACASSLGAFGVEWRTVKKKTQEKPQGTDKEQS